MLSVPDIPFADSPHALVTCANTSLYAAVWIMGNSRRLYIQIKGISLLWGIKDDESSTSNLKRLARHGTI